MSVACPRSSCWRCGRCGCAGAAGGPGVRRLHDAAAARLDAGHGRPPAFRRPRGRPAALVRGRIVDGRRAGVGSMQWPCAAATASTAPRMMSTTLRLCGHTPGYGSCGCGWQARTARRARADRPLAAGRAARARGLRGAALATSPTWRRWRRWWICGGSICRGRASATSRPLAGLSRLASPHLGGHRGGPVAAERPLRAGGARRGWDAGRLARAAARP